MIEWLAIPLAVAGAAFIPKGKMKDEKKIQQIFENKNICIKRGDSLQHPKLKQKHDKDGYTSYLYAMPYGIHKEDIDKILPAIKEGLNKEVEIEYDGLLKIEVFHEKVPEKWIFDESLLQPGTWQVSVGKNHKGILYHDFEKYPHLLTGGVTRFGKTVFLKETFHTLLLNQPNNVEFYILDLKGGLEFYKYSALPQVKSVACDVYEAAEVLGKIVEDLKKRELEFRQKGYTNIVDTPIQKRTFIIVDEGAELAPEIISGPAKKYAQFCQSALSEISRIGGGLGLRLLYCTQYPTKQAVPMQVKMNIVARLSFIAAAQVASMVILDEKGAEELPPIPGRAIYKVEKKRIVQVPYIDDKMIFSMMEAKSDVILNSTANRKPVDNDR